MVWQLVDSLAHGIENSAMVMVNRQNTLDQLTVSRQNTLDQLEVSQQNTWDQIAATRQNMIARIGADFGIEETREQFQSLMETRRQEFEVKKLKGQWLHQYALQQDSQTFQVELVKQKFENDVQLSRLNHENAMKLQAFREEWENLRLQKRLEFEARLFEERKQHEWALKQYDRETQLIIAGENLKNMLQSAEYNRILTDYPLNTNPTLTLDFYKQYRESNQPVPPLILISPPALEFEQFPHAAQGFSRLESKLTDGLQEFLNAHYPIHSPIRPTKFLSGVWKTKRLHSQAAIEIIYWTHKSVPTLLLESQVDDDSIRLYLAWWDMMDDKPQYEKVLTLNWKEILYPLARENARLWQEEREELLKEGQTPEQIEQENQDDEYNLRILTAEKRDQARGVDKQRDYKVNSERYIKELAEFLGFCHSILTGLVIDTYHLHNYRVRPQLPELLPTLLQKVPANLAQQLVSVIISKYRSLYQILQTQLPDWIPELALDLAMSLTQLADKTWARGQLNYAIQAWLALRNVQVDGDMDTMPLLAEMEGILVPADTPFMEKVNQCVMALGEKRQVSLEAFQQKQKQEEVARLNAEIDDLKRQLKEAETARIAAEERRKKEDVVKWEYMTLRLNLNVFKRSLWTANNWTTERYENDSVISLNLQYVKEFGQYSNKQYESYKSGKSNPDKETFKRNEVQHWYLTWFLNRASADGWELFSTSVLDKKLEEKQYDYNEDEYVMGGADSVLFIFRRPKQD
jgi:hypothetical protein